MIVFEQIKDSYDVYYKIQKAETSAAFLKNKASKKDFVSKISLCIGIAGFIVGVIGIIVNFI